MKRQPARSSSNVGRVRAGGDERRRDAGAQRAAWALLWFSVVVATPTLGHAQQLRVLARPSFQGVRTEAHPAGAKITGSLRDEQHAPIAGRPVSMNALGATATDCRTGENQAFTDDEGRFCFLLRGPLPDRAELAHQADGYVAASSRSVTVELAPLELGLQIELLSASWSVDDPPQLVGVSLDSKGDPEVHMVALSVQREGAPAKAIGEPQPLSVMKAAQFEVDPGQLGAPGPAKLVARLEDEPGRALATASVPLLLTAEVQLAWPEPLPEVRPELGFDVTIRVTTHAGPVADGWVETRVGDQVVGSGQVDNGTAVVASRFIASRQGTVLLSARYVSERPWLRSGPELQQSLTIAAVPWWVHLPWLICGVLAAVWIFRAWRRPTRATPPSGAAPPGTRAEGVAVIESSAQASGWRGKVVDLHTGDPVANASLKVTLPAVTDELTLVAATSGSDGSFELPATDRVAEGASWIVEAEHHSTLRRPVPPMGRLEVTLTSRRRFLLSHLIKWAEARGWAEPRRAVTPQELASSALEREREDVERWARDVERAVFGTQAPTATVERSLTRDAPAQDQASSHER